MNFRDFLALAGTLANETTEAEWRSACSRGYYAAFHLARQLLLGLNFRVPQADRAHGYLWLRLSNAGVADVTKAAGLLGDLRRDRERSGHDEPPTITPPPPPPNPPLAARRLPPPACPHARPVRKD